MHSINIAGTKDAVEELIKLLDPNVQMPHHHFCGRHEFVCGYPDTFCKIVMTTHDDGRITYKADKLFNDFYVDALNENMVCAITDKVWFKDNNEEDRILEI